MVAKEREANRLRKLGLAGWLLLRERRATPARIISILTNFPFILNTSNPQPPLFNALDAHSQKLVFLKKSSTFTLQSPKTREGKRGLAFHSLTGLALLNITSFQPASCPKTAFPYSLLYSPFASFTPKPQEGTRPFQPIHGRRPFNSSSSLKSHVCRCSRRQACHSRSRRLPFARMGQTICRA